MYLCQLFLHTFLELLRLLCFCSLFLSLSKVSLFYLSKSLFYFFVFGVMAGIGSGVSFGIDFNVGGGVRRSFKDVLNSRTRSDSTSKRKRLEDEPSGSEGIPTRKGPLNTGRM